jgi:hypothetical protein
MFGRRKQKKGSESNRLRNQSEPNTLSWTSNDAGGAEGAADFEDELEDGLDEDELAASWSCRPSWNARPRSSA